jgi:hypothetical protein
MWFRISEWEFVFKIIQTLNAFEVYNEVFNFNSQRRYSTFEKAVKSFHSSLNLLKLIKIMSEIV